MEGTGGAILPSLMTRTRSEQQTTKRPISPQEYAHQIDSHSKRSAAETVYPGANFGNLATYLLQTPDKHNAALPREKALADDSMSHTSFVTLYSLGGRINDEAVHFTLPTQLSNLDLDTPSDINGRLLFLRGNIAPEWLNAIGAKFHLDPEFFQRHLDFKRMVGRPDYFALPSLPSAANHMTRFRLNTIGYIMRQHRHRGWLEQVDLDTTRQRAEDSWSAYYERLSRGRGGEHRPGDSIVRDFSVHDHDHFSLEQDISVNITSTGDKWLAVVWLDVGRDLTLNSRDPWSPRLFQVDPLAISFLPTIQQRDHVALNSKLYTSKAATSSEGDTDPAPILQTASQLHLEYARRLDIDAARNGALIVLLDVLRLSASSEVQLLNMIETKVSTELSPAQSQAQNEPTVSNLLYHKRVLRRHMQRLLENKNFFEFQASTYSTNSSQATSTSHFTSKLSAILRDFDYLLEKTRELTTECDRGMTIMMNKASIKEAQKAIVQAERVTKLTKLAFIFVPLSFTSSFFGMNFSQLSSGSDLDIWIWFAISIPVLTLSTIFMKWDVSREMLKAPRWARRKGHAVDKRSTEVSSVQNDTKVASRTRNSAVV